MQKKPKLKLWTFYFHHLISYNAANFYFYFTKVHVFLLKYVSGIMHKMCTLI